MERVLVVDADARVRAALAALIDTTSGLHVAAAVDSTADAGAIARCVGATVAVVDVDASGRDDDFTVVRQLAEDLPVVAICYVAVSGARALAAGATSLCDKNGDPDALTTAVAAAARHRRGREGASRSQCPADAANPTSSEAASDAS